MRRMTEVVGQELEWVQPQMLTPAYELRAGGEPVAALALRSAFGSLATAECADGRWTFKRVGFWKTRVTVRAAGSDEDLAVFEHATWSGGGTIHLKDGRKYLATTNFWSTRFELQTEAGSPLLVWHTGGFLRMTARVDIHPEAARIPELPWLMLFGWYLIVMLHRDSAAAGGAVAAMG